MTNDSRRCAGGSLWSMINWYGSEAVTCPVRRDSLRARVGVATALASTPTREVLAPSNRWLKIVKMCSLALACGVSVRPGTPRLRHSACTEATSLSAAGTR